jgi:hypothetical protein
MDYNSFMSSALSGAGLTYDSIPTSLVDTISAFMNLPSVSALNAFVELSSAPIHPYEQLKANLFEEGYQLKTINDLPVPTDFHAEQAFLSVMKSTERIKNTLMHNVTCEPHLMTNTMLNSISGDTIMPDTDRYRSHIEFVEMIRNIPVHELSTNELLDYSKRIITEFTKRY